MAEQPSNSGGPPPRSASAWNSRYEQGDTPWDSGAVDHSLIEALAGLDVPRGAALEIGCGTGTNAIAIAQQGFSPVIAIDIAPLAIERAHARAQSVNANITFHVHDILSGTPIPGVPAQGVGLVFDRGVFHAIEEDRRPVFARRVADALAPRGWWLSLCGNADDLTPGGPPRLTATDIARAVEPLFEIHAITRNLFRDVTPTSPATGSTTYLNWRVLLRKR